MDTERLEKELPVWNHRMYVALSAAVALLIATVVPLLWVAWFVLLIFVTAVGFNLLWGRGWKNLPLSKERTNTIFGYLLASWFLLFVPLMLNTDICFLTFPLVYTIFLLVIYWRVRKKLSDAEEMFP
ncbi:MAG TPA: hypothetical protein VKP08_14055 [Anaerolineales bacterium]|nr:hypothetical protein [Anaerolineales bacterium]